jgi:hypothetical protein
MNGLLRPTLAVTIAWLILGQADPARAGYVFTTINGPGSTDTEAYGISNNGTVSGLFGDSSGNYHGFLDRAGTFTQVDVPASYNAQYTYLYEGNDHGLFAANYGDSSGNGHTAIFDSVHGTWTALPDADPTSVNSLASAIDNAGQVFGNWTPNADFSNNTGWVYQNGHYSFFTAPGASPSFFGTLTYNANNAGTVVGFYEDSTGTSHGFERFANGTIISVDYPGATDTRIYGINDQGVVTGRYLDALGDRHPFILANGVYAPMTVPGFTNAEFTGINNSGVVVGYAFNDLNTGPFVAFVGTPTPEPSTLVLMGLGGLVMVWQSRSRRRA